MRRGALLWTIAVAFLLGILCTVDRIAGNSSEVGNPTVVGVLYEPEGKKPAVGVQVVMRPKRMLADYSGTGSSLVGEIDSAMTNDSGRFAFDTTVSLGTYVIEATSGNDAVLIDSVVIVSKDSTVCLSPRCLKPAGAIKGVIALSEGGDPRKVFLLAYGLDRFAFVDEYGGFRFNKLAEGVYNLRFISTLDMYGVFDTMSIPVTSADTTDLGAVEIPYLGIPTLRHIAVSYDTLKQWVTLRWNRPESALVESFNVYRRAVDPITAIFTQLNFFPITDTVFVDSFCEQNRTYEYQIAAADSDAIEGRRSPGVQARITLYEITPKNVTLFYDTLKQMVTLRWSNPDTALVHSFNVYRRNINRNETFWTPFNDSPFTDTIFIDSIFNMRMGNGFEYDDSIGLKEPSYEYCVAALVHDIREGVRSTGIPVRICLGYITPKNVFWTYDTLKQMVHLRWGAPDMTLVQGFIVFRRNVDLNETVLTRLNSILLNDTCYTDSLAEQNHTFEYRIASVVKNVRAEVKSAGVKVRIAASFIEDSVFCDIGMGQGQLSYPNDVAVAKNGDIYIVDQGNSRIQIFDSTMQYKRQINNSVLRHPLKISVDEHGKVFAASFNIDRGYSSIYIFDSTGAVVDTVLDSAAINDFDVRDGLLYVVTEGRFISIHSLDGGQKISWQASGQDIKSIVVGDKNKIIVSAGLLFPDIADKNKVIVFDSLGNRISSFALSSSPYAIAFDEIKRLLYIVCFNGVHECVLHVVDGNNVARASYKIRSDDGNISMGIQKNGAVFLVIKSEGRILKLKPLFQ